MTAGVDRSTPAAAIDRFLRHVAVERGLADNTLAAYRRDLARYAEHLASLGRDDVAAVTRRTSSAFLATVRRDAGAAPSSAARMLSTVRGLHRFLVEDGTCRNDAAHATAPPKVPMPPPEGDHRRRDGRA